MRTRSRATPPIAALLAACTASIASAQTTTWTNPNGGLWHDPANWSDGVPGAGQHAWTTGVLSGPIVLNAPGRCDALHFAEGAVELVLNGHNIALAGDAWVGSSTGVSTATIRDGSIGSLGFRALRVGVLPGDDAFCSLTRVVGYFGLQIGSEFGIGVVEVGQGTSLSCGCAGWPGVQIAQGSVLRILPSASLAAGFNCNGRIEVAEGGQLFAADGYQTSLSLGPQGTLVLSGQGSMYSGQLGGTGTVELHPGSIIDAPSGGVVGAARVRMTGGSIGAGNLGANDLVIEAGSQVALSGSLGGAEVRILQQSHASCFELTAGHTSIEDSTLTTRFVWGGMVEIAGPQASFSFEGGYGDVHASGGALITSASVPDGTGISLGGFLPERRGLESSWTTGAKLIALTARLWSTRARFERDAELHCQVMTVGGYYQWMYVVGDDAFALPYTRMEWDPSVVAVCTSLSLLRGSSIGLFTAAGSMTGTITLDGILRPSGFLLDGSITASPTGLVEVSLDAAAPAIAATGACNLAPGLTIVTREDPTIAGDSWPIITASSLSLGEIALPSLPPNLEWDLTQTPTSLSITANTTTARCRPSVDRLSPATIDGYVGDPVLLAAAVSGPETNMRWHKDGLPLTDGGIYAGTATPTLAIASNAPVNLARYHLIATGPCGNTASLPIDASIRCGGDFNQDFSVDGDDVIDFFGPWDAGEIEADWNHDGAVDGDDVIGFFAKWDSGC